MRIRSKLQQGQENNEQLHAKSDGVGFGAGRGR
jgi:hypothetical protein